MVGTVNAGPGPDACACACVDGGGGSVNSDSKASMNEAVLKPECVSFWECLVPVPGSNTNVQGEEFDAIEECLFSLSLGPIRGVVLGVFGFL